MKSAPKLSTGWAHQEKYEILLLQRENSSLRTQLKSFGTKLTELIQNKDAKASKKSPIQVPPEEELKEINKLLEISRKEKKSLGKRLKKALNLEYFNKLSEKVEKTSKKLAEFEAQKKNNELNDKKEHLYRQTPVKIFDHSTEINYLSSKKHEYQIKIQEMEENLEKSDKVRKAGEKRIEILENDYKALLQELGEPYLKVQSQKLLVDTIKKKKQIENSISNETNSKLNSMKHKVKKLQNELKTLKESEDEIYSQVLSLSKQVELNSQKIRKSPIFINNKSLFALRSRSVKPHLNLRFNDVSY